MHGLAVVGHAVGLARRRGACCLGIQVGHRPIVSVFAHLAGLVYVPQLDRERMARAWPFLRMDRFATGTPTWRPTTAQTLKPRATTRHSCAFELHKRGTDPTTSVLA